MKTFLSIFAAILLAGAVLIGYVNHTKSEDAKWKSVLELGNKNIFLTAELVSSSPTKEYVIEFRDAVKRQREVLARNVGPEEDRIKAKDQTDHTLDQIASYLEVKSDETKELAKLLDGL